VDSSEEDASGSNSYGRKRVVQTFKLTSSSVDDVCDTLDAIIEVNKSGVFTTTIAVIEKSMFT